MNKDEELLKNYAKLKDYGMSTQDEYVEYCEIREKCKADEKDVILDSYRIKLGRALNKIDELEIIISGYSNNERKGAK